MKVKAAVGLMPRNVSEILIRALQMYRSSTLNWYNDTTKKAPL